MINVQTCACFRRGDLAKFARQTRAFLQRGNLSVRVPLRIKNSAGDLTVVAAPSGRASQARTHRRVALQYLKISNKIVFFAIIVGLNISLISCNSLISSNLLTSKAIIPINAIAEKSKTETIYITGKVTKVAPLLGNNAYQVQDSTGTIWVITTANLPSVGQNILIKCHIKSQSLSLISQELEELYLVELEQLENP